MNGHCEACRASTSGRRDILCTGCWPKVPTALKALYRLTWRLVTAGLVMEEAKLELERIIIREAREAIGVALVPAAGAPRARAGSMVALDEMTPQCDLSRAAFLQATGRKVAVPMKAAVQEPRAPKPARVRPSPTRDALLAALPLRPEEAISTAAAAVRAGVDPRVAEVTLGNLRRDGWPGLRALNDRPQSTRGRYRYWFKADAQEVA